MGGGTASTEPQLTLRGRVERITFASPETGFAVLRVRPTRGASFTATGHVPELVNQAGLEGTDFQFSGAWTLTKYGRQFAFTSCKLLGSELLFFLSRVVKGLGGKLAAELVERFGEEALVRILDQEPEELLKVKGIKEKRLALIIRSWHKHRSLRTLAEYLGGHGSVVTPNLLIRIYNHFEDHALVRIRENPYCLTEVRGIGFRTADRIATGLGVQPDAPARIQAAIQHTLLQAAESEGHCFLPQAELVSSAVDVLAPEAGTVEPAVVQGVLKPMILEGTLVQGEGQEIGLASHRYMEDWLKDFFLARSGEADRKVLAPDMVAEFLNHYERASGLELAGEQREIVTRVATEPRLAFALAGYAGTGKTTVCKAILDLLSRHYVHRDHIVCCAFTGMASSRLRKATGYEAFTIHSLLKYKGDGQFEYGGEKPLPYKLVVLDEASMVNLPLFFRLARALRPDALLLLVGDPAQLPPIGPGNVFSDALRTRLVPAVQLTRIYRQSDDSVLTIFANEIRQGRVPERVEEPGWRDFAFENVERFNIYALKRQKTDQELKVLREQNNQAILERIRELAGEYRSRLSHPVWDFQVLTPMRVGQLGTEILNPLLQDILNPSAVGQPAFSRAGINLREGDKVVHLQNRDMQVMAWEDFVRQGKRFEPAEFRRIFNGNVGLVSRIDPEAEQFCVVYPERVVVAYDFDHLGDIVELAYALTVHKAQGNQYRVVVIPLTNSHFIMLTNKWFYTAVTRAEEKVYLIGQTYALKRACTNVEGVRRRTWLGLSAS